MGALAFALQKLYKILFENLKTHRKYQRNIQYGHFINCPFPLPYLNFSHNHKFPLSRPPFLSSNVGLSNKTLSHDRRHRRLPRYYHVVTRSSACDDWLNTTAHYRKLLAAAVGSNCRGAEEEEKDLSPSTKRCESM